MESKQTSLLEFQMDPWCCTQPMTGNPAAIKLGFVDQEQRLSVVSPGATYSLHNIAET